MEGVANLYPGVVNSYVGVLNLQVGIINSLSRAVECKTYIEIQDLIKIYEAGVAAALAFAASSAWYLSNILSFIIRASSSSLKE